MTDPLTPYPLMFCPPEVTRPACCPHQARVRVIATGGPEGNGGTCWGGPYNAEVGTWTKAPAGWWLHLAGHQPNHLTRIETNPRVIRWTNVPGVQEGHWWRIPVLLTKVMDNEGQTFVSALDRVWNGQEWTIPGELGAIQQELQAVMYGIPAAQELEARNEAVRRLAVRILALGQWVDEDFLAVTGWLGERLILRTLWAACDLEESAVALAAD